MLKISSSVCHEEEIHSHTDGRHAEWRLASHKPWRANSQFASCSHGRLVANRSRPFIDSLILTKHRHDSSVYMRQSQTRSEENLASMLWTLRANKNCHYIRCPRSRLGMTLRSQSNTDMEVRFSTAEASVPSLCFGFFLLLSLSLSALEPLERG